MRSVVWILLGLDQLFLLLIGSVQLDTYEISDFQLREQFAASDDTTKLRRQLHKNLPAVRRLQQVELVIAASFSLTLLIWLTSPWLGLLCCLLTLLVLVCVSRVTFVQRLSHHLFESTLSIVIKTVLSLEPLWRIIGLPAKRKLVTPTTQAEFADQLRRLPSTVLPPDERQRLETLLSAQDMIVSSIMTPKKRVVMVEPSATLGPVVLTDLQKSHHGYFPVATPKGEPEGILSLSDISDIQNAKQRSQVRDLMSQQIAWVDEDVSLYELAQAFLQEKQYLILVKNKEGLFSGIVTIADLMKHLVGVVKD